MAMSVTYGTFAGHVVYENRGGVESTYMRDQLGNTVGLMEMNGHQTDSWTYWPFGEVRTHTGSSTTPLTFLGTLGYFVDFLNQLYVRARHLRTDLTRWLSTDGFWPQQPAYQYADCAPVLKIDPSGRFSIIDVIKECGMGLAGMVGDILSGQKFPDGNSWCKFGGSCVAALAGLIFGAILLAICPECEPLIACAANMLASILTTLVDVKCHPVPCGQYPLSPCKMGAAALDLIMSCIGGLVGQIPGVGGALGEALAQFDSAMMGGLGCPEGEGSLPEPG